MSLAAGVQLGAYEILSVLGAGAMGEVYLAHDGRLGRDVAIKVLPSAVVYDPDRLRRFEREARAAAALNHPNIVAVHDIGRHGDTPYIVMEYVRGETLAAYLQRQRPSQVRALEIGIEIADALAMAHGGGVVHRDLKPGNVMITPDGHVKVLDFGLAKNLALTSGGTTIGGSPMDEEGTIVGQVLGTPGYMSPEQRLGQPVDYRSDIYSLGVMLYQLVTGKRPYQAGIDALTAPVPSACKADPSVPAAVGDLVARAMARAPSDRPQSVDALKTELKRLHRAIDASTGALTEELSSQGSRRFVRRNAAWTLVAVIGLALAVIPISRWFGPTRGPAAARPVIAVLPLTNLSGDESKAYLGVGIADALTTSLGRFAGVSIVSRSALEEAGALKTTDVSKIAASLGATMVVQGSVQQSNDRLRVNANLMTADGKIVWSGDSESAASDLFAAEDRLAGSLIEALRITVSSEERQRMATPPTGNRAALDAYWQGLAQLDRVADEPAYFDRAIVSFQRAVSLDPRFSLAHAALGNAYRGKARATNDRALMNQATEQVAEALRIDPNQTEARLSLANIYRATGRNGAAVEELRRALTDQPSNDDARRLLGDILAAEGRPDEALVELQRAVALRPQYWRNQQSLGVFYLRTRKLNEAITTFTRLTELKPDDDLPYQQLGAAYQTLGDNTRARQNYERSIALNPNPGSYTNLGTILYAEGKYEEAARAYEEAIRLSPKRALYRRNVADAYVKLKRTADARDAYEKAVQLAEEALTVNPSDATTISQLGVYEAKLGRRLDAERHANGAAAINPTSPDVLYRRAVVLALNGKPDAALKQVSEAIARGYSKQLAREDDDLSSLRSLPTFQTLVAPAK